MYGEEEEAYRLLVGKPMRKRPLGSPWHRWEDNNKKNLKENGWELVGVDLFASRYGQVAGSYEQGTGFLDCMRCGELIA